MKVEGNVSVGVEEEAEFEDRMRGLLHRFFLDIRGNDFRMRV